MRDQDICGDDVKGSIASFIREGYFIFYYLTIKLRAVCPVVFNPKVYSGFKRRREEKLYIRINLIRLIISVISLIGLFSGIVSYLIILDLSFIGLSYVIVYVGAVSILFLFILMLIDIRISELENYSNNSIHFSLGVPCGIILCKQTNIGIRFYSSKVKLCRHDLQSSPRIPFFLQYQVRRIEKHNLSLTASTTTTMNP